MKEHYDRKVFFDAVRESPFPGRLTQGQVDGMSQFLSAWEPTPFKDRRCLAYCLGTQPIETAWTMQPIEEFGKGRGHKYGVPGRNGGQIPYGRGYVQLTWDENYERADKELGLNGRLVADYSLALDPDIAAKIMIYGMEGGWFTGKRLSDYFNARKTDWVNARRIVNGLDRAHEIAGHAQAFYAALSKAATVEEPDQPSNEPPPTNPKVAVLTEQIAEATGMSKVGLVLEK